MELEFLVEKGEQEVFDSFLLAYSALLDALAPKMEKNFLEGTAGKVPNPEALGYKFYFGTVAPPHPPDSAEASERASASAPVPSPELSAVYRRLMLIHHPDRGGDETIAQKINMLYGAGDIAGLLRLERSPEISQAHENILRRLLSPCYLYAQSSTFRSIYDFPAPDSPPRSKAKPRVSETNSPAPPSQPQQSRERQSQGNGAKGSSKRKLFRCADCEAFAFIFDNPRSRCPAHQ